MGDMRSPLHKQHIQQQQQQQQMQQQQQQQPVFKGVRSSKFRHVYGLPMKKELCYDNIKITKNANDSNFCAVNPKFMAVVTETAGGGSFIVIPLNQTGRIEGNTGRVTGHRGPVLDLKWCPFNDNLIASSSDDCTIKLWYIADDGVPHQGLHESILTLAEHKRRVSHIEWHPTADGVLLSVGLDQLIYLWDVTRGDLIGSINCHPDTIQSVSFNRDGTLLATTCKDKTVRIIDPRTGKLLQSGIAHHGPKSSKVVFLGNSTRLFTTGFSKFSDRQWAVWSQFDMSKPLRIENIDSSSGILFPFYDHDSKMVYLAGKGDGSIRYYELIDEAPWCYYISQYITGHPQRGLGVMPKRGLDVLKCEIFRFYKLHATRPQIEPISMIVPRKSSQFQADLYPDTAAPVPALMANEWMNGKCRNPILISMTTGAGVKTNKPAMVIRSKDNAISPAVDMNNERKFIFLQESNDVDYRSKGLNRSKTINAFTNNNNQSNYNYNNNLINGLKRNSRFPWSKSTENMQPNGRDKLMICDIVRSHQMPTATFVTVNSNSGHDATANDTNNSPTGHLSEHDLFRELIVKHAAEVRTLKEQIRYKDHRIAELEKYIGDIKMDR